VQKNIVHKIATLNSIISTIVPIADIPITYFLTDTMLKLIASLSIHPDRNISTYKKTYTTILVIVNTIRAGSLITGGILELLSPLNLGITLAIGSAVGGAASFAITEGIGNHAIGYFAE